jgi:hypothetical protein
MKTLLIILLLCPSATQAQLFNKLERKKKNVEPVSDTVYLKYFDFKTTVEDTVYHYEDVADKKRYQIPSCNCIDMKGKKVGDTVTIARLLFDKMILEASKPKNRSKRSLLEN